MRQREVRESNKAASPGSGRNLDDNSARLAVARCVLRPARIYTGRSA
jgi:hypothetical protein